MDVLKKSLSFVSQKIGLLHEYLPNEDKQQIGKTAILIFKKPFFVSLL